MALSWEERPSTFLRIRPMNPDVLHEGQLVLMSAIHRGDGRITIRPCQLEWFDGLEWVPVKFSEGK